MQKGPMNFGSKTIKPPVPLIRNYKPQTSKNAQIGLSNIIPLVHWMENAITTHDAF